MVPASPLMVSEMNWRRGETNGHACPAALWAMLLASLLWLVQCPSCRELNTSTCSGTRSVCTIMLPLRQVRWREAWVVAMFLVHGGPGEQVTSGHRCCDSLPTQALGSFLMTRGREGLLRLCEKGNADTKGITGGKGVACYSSEQGGKWTTAKEAEQLSIPVQRQSFI